MISERIELHFISVDRLIGDSSIINGALDFVFLKFLTLRGIFTCSYRVPFEGTDARVLRQSFAVRDDPNRSDLKSGTFGDPGILRQFPGRNCPIRAELRGAYLELGYETIGGTYWKS